MKRKVKYIITSIVILLVAVVCIAYYFKFQFPSKTFELYNNASDTRLKLYEPIRGCTEVELGREYIKQFKYDDPETNDFIQVSASITETSKNGEIKKLKDTYYFEQTLDSIADSKNSSRVIEGKENNKEKFLEYDSQKKTVIYDYYLMKEEYNDKFQYESNLVAIVDLNEHASLWISIYMVSFDKKKANPIKILDNMLR